MSKKHLRAMRKSKPDYENRLDPFSPKQQQAIRNMEHAMAECQRAGIVLFGMDRELYAYDRKELTALGYFKGINLHNINPDRKVIIESESYEDSGGW